MGNFFDDDFDTYDDMAEELEAQKYYLEHRAECKSATTKEAPVIGVTEADKAHCDTDNENIPQDRAADKPKVTAQSREVPPAVTIDASLPSIVMPPQILPGLYRGDYGVLTAAGGTGKSYATLVWAIFRLLGLEFYGDRALPKIQRATVLCLEDNEYIIQDRITRILQFYSRPIRNYCRDYTDISSETMLNGLIPKEQIPDVLSRLTVRALKGHGAVQIIRHTNGAATICRQDLEYLSACARDTMGQSPEMLAIDPLIKVGGYAENNNEEAALFAAAIESMALDLNCTVLLTHHISKYALEHGSDNQQAARGASAVVDESRATYPLSRDDYNHGKDTIVGLSIDSPKLNYCAPIPKAQFYRSKSGVLVPEIYSQYWPDTMASESPKGTTGAKKGAAAKKKRQKNIEVDKDEA